MQQAAPTIDCPNLRCRAANLEGDRVCQTCGTSIPLRYLWVANAPSNPYQAGDRVLERYLFKTPQVVLDTQPGLPLASAFDLPDSVLPYLKLFPFRLHLPQLYSLLKLETAAAEPQVLALLEDAPLTAADFSQATTAIGIFPDLLSQIAVAEIFTEAWRTAPVLRQVNWLWQMVQLWEPLQRECVAWSLMNPDLLRVEGSLLRLLSLDFNPRTAPALAALGEFWVKWCLPDVGQWRTKFSELCDRLISEEINTVEALSAELEAWQTAVRAASQVRIDISTRTDPGPSRDQNEDACYPHDGMVLQNIHEGLMIVCDGVGGHEGGEVASGIAIAVLTEHLKETPQMSPGGVMTECEIAVGMANDLIVKQNDQEDRHDRDRMGTTVVMALAQGHDLYLTNLGDSRAYLITQQGCYQLTTDDDIATREVRLGYLPYRDAVRQPGSGSLIQALGMVPSTMLRPSVQRFIVDSDCLFLLCSDGLSDFERVETLWQQHLLPLLSGKMDLAETTKILIAEANRLNGHDNVTIGLLHYRVQDTTASAQSTQVEQSQAWQSPSLPTQAASAPPSTRSSRHSVNTSRQWLRWLMLALATLLGGIALSWLLWPKSVPKSDPVVVSPTPFPPPEPTVEDLKRYWTVRSSQGSATPSASVPVDLKLEPSPGALSLGSLSNDMVLKILSSQQNAEDQTRWLSIQVCGRLPNQASSPSGQPVPVPPRLSPNLALSDRPSVKPGIKGYVKSSDFFGAAMRLDSAKVGILNFNGCSAPVTVPPTSSPVPEETTQ
jgi:protein phosphatase